MCGVSILVGVPVCVSVRELGEVRNALNPVYCVGGGELNALK